MQKYNNFTIAFFILLAISGCSGDRRAGTEKWRRRTGVEMAGTRLETHQLDLFYRDRPLPPGIQVIVCPLGRYYFRAGVNRTAGRFGWIPENNLPAGAPRFSWEIPAAVARIKSVSRYWYPSPLKGKRRGTPSSWIWVQVAGKGYWMDPDGMDYFVPIWSASGKR